MAQSRMFTVWNKSNGLCVYCGAVAEHCDHVIPKVKGGSNDADNLVAACALCNTRKHNRSVEEFRLYLSLRNAGLVTAKVQDYKRLVELGADIPIIKFYREDILASMNGATV